MKGGAIMAQKNPHIAGLPSALCGMGQLGVGAPFF
jgi:hypothetical protein